MTSTRPHTGAALPDSFRRLDERWTLVGHRPARVEACTDTLEAGYDAGTLTVRIPVSTEIPVVRSGR